MQRQLNELSRQSAAADGTESADGSIGPSIRAGKTIPRRSMRSGCFCSIVRHDCFPAEPAMSS